MSESKGVDWVGLCVVALVVLFLIHCALLAVQPFLTLQAPIR